jgi:hypothetical protein
MHKKFELDRLDSSYLLPRATKTHHIRNFIGHGAFLYAIHTCMIPVTLDIIHISIWNVSFSILIGQNSVAEWLSG